MDDSGFVDEARALPPLQLRWISMNAQRKTSFIDDIAGMAQDLLSNAYSEEPDLIKHAIRDAVQSLRERRDFLSFSRLVEFLCAKGKRDDVQAMLAQDESISHFNLVGSKLDGLFRVRRD